MDTRDLFLCMRLQDAGGRIDWDSAPGRIIMTLHWIVQVDIDVWILLCMYIGPRKRRGNDIRPQLLLPFVLPCIARTCAVEEVVCIVLAALVVDVGDTKN